MQTNTKKRQNTFFFILKTKSNAQLQVFRRSRSEGPSPARGPLHSTDPGLMAAWVGRRRHVTEQKPIHWLTAVRT